MMRPVKQFNLAEKLTLALCITVQKLGTPSSKSKSVTL